MKPPQFLELDDVLAVHADQVARYGGTGGIRDLGLLQSALGMPRASFDGQFLHPSLPEMAAAYLFHLVMNHAIAFLGMNDLWLEAGEDELTTFVLDVAKGELQKADAAVFVRRRCGPFT